MKRIIIPLLFLSIGASIIFYFLGNLLYKDYPRCSSPYAAFILSIFFSILLVIRVLFDRNLRKLIIDNYYWVLKNYIRVLIIWAAFGITITGLFFIFPPQKDTYYEKTKSYGNSNYYKVSALFTIVGVLLIGGLGAASKKKIE